MYALEVKKLSKSFGDLKAVNEASFNVPEGSIFGLIGRNGAGKTTTIRMMMNIYMPDSGDVILRGASIGQDFKNKVGYLPEERGLYKKMKVLETLLFFAELKGKSGKTVQKKAKEYLERFDLKDRMNSKIEDLSKGNQQKVQFISTILHDPEFLILDEPFSGLDPINTNLLKEIILEKKSEGKVIIFSTHLMDFAEKMCDHLAIIDKGKIILEGSLNELKQKYAKSNVSLSFEGDLSFLKNHSMIDKIENFGNTTGIRVKSPEQIQDLLKLLVQNNITIKKFDANDISLHEIFVEVAGNDGVALNEEVLNV
jgi:ABC-2 type transport system ATP-binding protein